MCKTEDVQQMPLPITQAGDPGDPLSPNFTPGAPPSGPGLPTSVNKTLSVGVKTPTKFGSLLKFLAPALEGGVIGAFGGKGHPGGGFGAANDYFNQRRAINMQNALMQRQFANDSFKNALEAARTQHELQIPPFTRIPNAIHGVDANGNRVFQTFNPFTGQYETLDGITPDDPKESYSPLPTDQGIMTFNRNSGEITPGKVATPNQPAAQQADQTQTPASTPVGNKKASQFDSGSPRIPGPPTASPTGIKQNAAGQSLPLRPSGYSTPKPTVRASRNSAGVETDNLIDTNPNSPTFGKKIASTGNTRAPLPDRSAEHNDEKTDTTGRVETYAAEFMKQNGGDPDKAIADLNGWRPPDPKMAKEFEGLLPQIRKSIRDRGKKVTKKPRLSLSPQDAAAAGLQPTNSSSMMDDEDQ